MSYNKMLNSEEFEKKLELDNTILKAKIQQLKDSVKKISIDTRLVVKENVAVLKNNFSEENKENNVFIYLPIGIK